MTVVLKSREGFGQGTWIYLFSDSYIGIDQMYGIEDRVRMVRLIRSEKKEKSGNKSWKRDRQRTFEGNGVREGNVGRGLRNGEELRKWKRDEVKREKESGEGRGRGRGGGRGRGREERMLDSGSDSGSFEQVEKRGGRKGRKRDSRWEWTGSDASSQSSEQLSGTGSEPESRSESGSGVAVTRPVVRPLVIEKPESAPVKVESAPVKVESVEEGKDEGKRKRKRKPKKKSGVDRFTYQPEPVVDVEQKASGDSNKAETAPPAPVEWHRHEEKEESLLDGRRGGRGFGRGRTERGRDERSDDERGRGGRGREGRRGRCGDERSDDE
jgi:hypothetical protein